MSMKIKLNRHEDMGDWYTIVRAEHDGRDWMERIGPNSQRLMCSERLSPEACIEGFADEMLRIAEAIQARGEVSFKRCAVRVDGETAYFCSPKNSEHDAAIPLADADEFAAEVLAVLRPNARLTCPQGREEKHEQHAKAARPCGSS